MKKQQVAIDKFLDDKYIPLESKFKIIIGVLLIALPIALCYFFVFKPNNDTITKLDKSEATLKKSVASVKKRAADLDKFEKAYKDTQDRFNDTAMMLPKDKEIPQLLKDISGLGQNAGLDFLTFKPRADIPKDFYAEIPVDINVRGPYHNMGFFLDQVSKLDRIVTVSNIKMSSPAREGSEMLLKSTCQLVTYRFTNKALEKKDNKKKRKTR